MGTLGWGPGTQAKLIEGSQTANVHTKESRFTRSLASLLDILAI